MESVQNTAFTQMNSMLTKGAEPEIKTTAADIDPDGLYRWAQIKDILPISESTWRRRIADKKAPPPMTLGTRCTLWRGSDVLEWLRQPDIYTAD